MGYRDIFDPNEVITMVEPVGASGNVTTIGDYFPLHSANFLAAEAVGEGDWVAISTADGNMMEIILTSTTVAEDIAIGCVMGVHAGGVPTAYAIGDVVPVMLKGGHPWAKTVDVGAVGDVIVRSSTAGEGAADTPAATQFAGAVLGHMMTLSDTVDTGEFRCYAWVNPG